MRIKFILKRWWRERDHPADLEGRMILKRMLNEWDVKMCMGFSWLRIESSGVVVFYGRVNGLLVS
jgi:hypothetical protein